MTDKEELKKAQRDALIYGTVTFLDGKRISPWDLFKEPPAWFDDYGNITPEQWRSILGD